MRKLLFYFSVLLILSNPLAQAAETESTVKADATAKPALPEYKAKSPQLKRADLNALLAKPENLVIIDVRRPDEVTAIGGLPVYLSIQAADIEKYLAFIPKDRVIVTVSNHAGRAGTAADLLVGHGFNVAGAIGVQNYEAEGGTLTKVAPPPPRSAATEKQ